MAWVPRSFKEKPKVGDPHRLGYGMARTEFTHYKGAVMCRTQQGEWHLP